MSTALTSKADFARVLALILLISAATFSSNSPISAQSRRATWPAKAAVPKAILLQIIRAEDERRWDSTLSRLLTHQNPAVRARTALAAGRIGNQLAVPALAELLRNDKDHQVQELAAFALGETEAATAGDVLLGELSKRTPVAKARMVEALGKIAAALPPTDETRLKAFRDTIKNTLKFEADRRSRPDGEVIKLGITASLRARPEEIGSVLAQFLSYSDPSFRADAANALARLRAKDGNEELLKLLVNDHSPIVRANAARVLGATEEKFAFPGLLNRAVKDPDKRVRVSAIRSLAALKDPSAVTQLMRPVESITTDELLEIATTTGRLLSGSNNQDGISWLRKVREHIGRAPEVEIASVRVAPAVYLEDIGSGDAGIRKAQETIMLNWRAASALAQGLGEIAALPDTTAAKSQLSERAQKLLRAMLDYRNSGIMVKTLVAVHSEYAVPDVLRAFAAFKPEDLDDISRAHLKASDEIIRSTAAELLGELPLNSMNIEALGNALELALHDQTSNDAALAILDALAKQKNRNANEAIKIALDSSDYLVRRKAIESLKATGAGDFSARLGFPQTRNTTADYARAINRIGKRVLTIVSTNKGSFTIQLLPDDATLNVDNFVQLAKRGYFNGIVFHRVVPNFVVQGGDPRGDGSGGPGYAIRCEINQVSYLRGAVGMALSGKDTGGSQWFVTHTPQPHLDGGYTVFGTVIDGMDVVDNIVRGDVIRSIIVRE